MGSSRQDIPSTNSGNGSNSFTPPDNSSPGWATALSPLYRATCRKQQLSSRERHFSEILAVRAGVLIWAAALCLATSSRNKERPGEDFFSDWQSSRYACGMCSAPKGKKRNKWRDVRLALKLSEFERSIPLPRVLNPSFEGLRVESGEWWQQEDLHFRHLYELGDKDSS